MDVPKDTWITIPTRDGGTIRFCWTTVDPSTTEDEE